MALHYKTDVVIIGGGIAGIVCALELLDCSKNAQILILDRDTVENFGGLAKESFGGILLVNTPEQQKNKIPDHPDLALRDWFRFGEFGRDPEAEYWPAQWAEHYLYDSREYLYEWLKARGIRFLPLPLWVERGVYGNGNSVPRWHVVWGTGYRLASRLIEVLQSHPEAHRVTLQFNHQVQGLQKSAGQINGCFGVVQEQAQEFSVQADAVVIAAGGINGDLAQVRAHWHEDWGQAPATILNGAHKYADGTLHWAAQEHGAQVVGLQQMWNYAAGIHHWHPRKPQHGLSIVPPKTALWLNAKGERIGPMPLVSGYDTRDLVTQICKQPGGYSWQLMNRKIFLKELAISGAEFNPAIRNRKKLSLLKDFLLGNHWLYEQITQNSEDVVLADSLSELVDKMNQKSLYGLQIEARQLQDTVKNYDDAMRRGTSFINDEQIRRVMHLRRWRGDRLRVCKMQPILDGKAMPLVAIRQFIVSRKSLGGLRTNLKSQVLSRQIGHEPINGLYAIGEAAGFGGGGYSGLRSLEGTFLGGCIYTARRAAQAIAGAPL
ncbi:FAD-binding dehydrogenase [Brackiella oedipodis]|uniref:FAD-binding dehydrogenase n=1 Tax=Brackiella oedipodis TaxID=124225 RepID=UPI00048F7A93|nr:FAD-binding dehydrogenase [Brackiella oedipodis]